ncbi:CTD small phosphatase-like protein 2 isoform X1 [Senna tora]|uniref:CTD small phosphatase-like protein 2 isoform X1 n=1 Tax=Senna tora TaxID=362788 RepID=A0A834SF71_9FABA|nr:CTD small phosphatase-like protein 2 isoform X1 [Senna tora]
MPSVKMKSKVSTICLRDRKDLHVCPKSNIISKPCSKITISAQVAEIDTTVHNCQDVPSKMQVSPKDVEGDMSFDNKEFLDKEDSDFHPQESFYVGSPTLGRMVEFNYIRFSQCFFIEFVCVVFEALESNNLYTANLETIFSPVFEPIEVHPDHFSDKDAVGSIGYSDVRGLGTDENEHGRVGCAYETCDISDFYISDMIITSLPIDEDAFDDNIGETNCIADYKSSEPSMFDAADQYMVLPALEDDARIGNTSDIRSCQEAIMVQENVSLYSAMGQIRSYNQVSDLTNDSDKAECFDPQLFIKNLPELSDIESAGQLAVTSKESQRKKSVTLVLDLDETLVHSTLEHCDDADFTFTVFFNMKDYTVYVKKRPHLHSFMERVAEMFEVVIFTASQSIYAKQLLDILDPDGRLISRRVYRESCIFSDGNYTKDLTILGVDLAKVAIIDNSPQVFRLQVNNGIPIKSWFDDPLDCALMSLLPFLESLADADDVRPIIAKKFGNKE